MKNGCSNCAKLPDDKMCDACELEMLANDAEVARKAYQRKLVELQIEGQESD